MKKFYTLKKKNPDYCYGLLPSCERNVFSHNIICFQEVRDKNGSRIMTVHAGGIFFNFKLIINDSKSFNYGGY